MPPPIEDYALLGDSRAGALVSRDGSIDWLCQPRFDSAASFAALVGNAENGRWRIAPSGHVRRTRRRYRGETLVLETDFDTAEGSIRLVDFMPPGGKATHVVRLVEGVRGRVRVHMDLRPRFDHGRIRPRLRRIDGADVAIAGPDSVWLRTPVETRADDAAVRADSSSRPASSSPSSSPGIPRTSPHPLRSIRCGRSPTRSRSGPSRVPPPSNVGPR